MAPEATSARRAVYTALIGRYEALNEQPVAPQSGLPFICFTDDPALRSATWQIELVEASSPSDPIRSARRLKVLGHPRLDGFDETLWIDNAVLLRRPPEEILDDWLSVADVTMPAHSFRETLADEFDAVVHSGFDEPDRVYEQARHYFDERPEVMDAAPLWTALLARRRRPAVQEFERAWFDDLLRYSRRDQLSVVPALVRTPDLRWRSVELDNLTSALHEWPVAAERDRAARRRAPGEWQQPVALELRALRRRDEERAIELKRIAADLLASHEQSLALVEAINHRERLLGPERFGDSWRDVAEQAQRELAAVHASRSWRAARVLARLARPWRKTG